MPSGTFILAFHSSVPFDFSSTIVDYYSKDLSIWEMSCSSDSKCPWLSKDPVPLGTFDCIHLLVHYYLHPRSTPFQEQEPAPACLLLVSSHRFDP
jgi:hypothetical protein